MKKALLALILFVSIISAQSADLNDMIKHEYSFAEKAAGGSTRDAFLAFIADEGIIFRPHPVNGKVFLEKQKPNEGWLIWYPEKASISASGDIGYTTGPASFRKAKGDTTDIWFGNFCTVWRKQKDNSWKFLIDFGISNEKPTAKIKPLNREATQYIADLPLTELSDKSKIKSLEEMLSNVSSKAKFEKLFSGTRFLIDGFMPADGETNIIKLLFKKIIGEVKYNMIDGGISSAEDFAYAYGTVKYTDLKSSEPREDYYLRVWQKQKDEWKITIEVWNEKPKE